MNSIESVSVPKIESEIVMNNWSLKKIKEQIEFFFLDPASERPLAVLRIGIAIVLLAQVYFLRNSVSDFFSNEGIIQGELASYLSTPHTPRISWIVQALSYWGVSEATCIFSVCGIYVTSVILMGIGLWTRAASILTWFFHWTLINTGYTTAYGVDLYAHVFLFYLMWVPSGEVLSIDSLSHPEIKSESSAARLGIRVLQLHLCIAYFFSGIEKAQGIQWWNGELLWRAFSLPVYQQFDMNWLANWPMLSKLGCWGTLLIETCYCIFIWPKLTRKLWVASVVALHLGISVFLGLGLFGLIMCVLTFSLFGISSEPERKTGKNRMKRSEANKKGGLKIGTEEGMPALS